MPHTTNTRQDHTRGRTRSMDNRQSRTAQAQRKYTTHDAGTTETRPPGRCPSRTTARPLQRPHEIGSRRWKAPPSGLTRCRLRVYLHPRRRSMIEPHAPVGEWVLQTPTVGERSRSTSHMGCRRAHNDTPPPCICLGGSMGQSPPLCHCLDCFRPQAKPTSLAAAASGPTRLERDQTCRWLIATAVRFPRVLKRLSSRCTTPLGPTVGSDVRRHTAACLPRNQPRQPACVTATNDTAADVEQRNLVRGRGGRVRTRASLVADGKQ